MRMKFFATTLLGLALFTADVLSAQSTPTDTKKPNDPSALSWRKNRKIAKKLLKKGNDEAAIPYLEAGAQKKPKKVYFPENLGKSEFAIRDYKASNKWYKVLVDKDSAKHKKPQYLFEYARTQKFLGQYEEAQATFAKYRKLAGDDDESLEMKKRATREIEGCQKGIYFRDSVPNKAFKVKHLDANINQTGADFSPVLKGDNALYYASTTDNSFSRIMKSVKQGKEWGKGESISDNINAANVQVGNPTFTQDGNTMYYTQCAQEPKTLKTKCQIYKSTMTNGVWEKGVSAGTQVNDPLYTSTQPAVGKNKDGDDVVYFISDRNAGKGMDIFYSKINPDGTLGKPRSAGSQINSRGDEMSPYFDFKSKTLYFSSNGWINIGGMDVFKTSWDQNGEWLEPENMGTPINSSVDDYYFSLNDLGTLGFVVSNRVGGLSAKSETCCDDIYQVQTTKLYLAVRGNVFEEVDNYRVLTNEGKVTLYDDRNGIELGTTNIVNGAYFFDLEPKRGYKLLTRKDGFQDGLLPFTTDNSTENDTFQYDLFLKKKVAANPLIGRVIGKIYYDYDQAKLRADSRDSLRKVMDILNQYPNVVVEVGAHTDGKGTEDYNIALSKRRADAVMNYYIYEKKVNAKRLIAKPYGTSQPVASNTTPDGKDYPEGRAQNRRTEFKIIDELKGDDTITKAAPKNQTTTLIADAKKEEAKKPAKKTEAAKEKKTAEPKAADKKEKKSEDKPAKVIVKDITTGNTVKETKTKEQPATAETKKETAPAPKVEVKKEASKPAEDGYATAPTSNIVVKGKVYTEKGGRRLLMTEGAVFLTSDEAGFQQKIFYVKNDGTYSFDLSRAHANSFKLTARKDKYESNEVVFTLDDIKADNKPIDLVVKSK